MPSEKQRRVLEAGRRRAEQGPMPSLEHAGNLVPATPIRWRRRGQRLWELPAVHLRLPTWAKEQLERLAEQLGLNQATVGSAVLEWVLSDARKVVTAVQAMWRRNNFGTPEAK